MSAFACDNCGWRPTQRPVLVAEKDGSNLHAVIDAYKRAADNPKLSMVPCDGRLPMLLCPQCAARYEGFCASRVEIQGLINRLRGRSYEWANTGTPPSHLSEVAVDHEGNATFVYWCDDVRTLGAEDEVIVDDDDGLLGTWAWLTLAEAMKVLGQDWILSALREASEVLEETGRFQAEAGGRP